MLKVIAIAALRLLLAVAASLSGTGLVGGCASEQSLARDGLPGETYRFLYPRQHYDSVDARQQKEMEQQALQDEVRSERK